MKTAVVTDTNSGMTMEECRQLGVYLLPMPIIINGRDYYENVDISYDAFFERLKEGADVSTSQPSPDSVMSVWDEALKTHSQVIHIPMSSALSGSCATAQALASEYNGKVVVADNKRISISQYRSVLDALSLASQGYKAADIAALLESKAFSSSIYLSVNTLELLKRSGRVTPAAAALGTILSIKPVLQIQGGKLDSFAKVRGMKQAEKTMLEAIQKDKAERFIGKKAVIQAAYSGNREDGEMWLKKVQDYFHDYSICLYRLPLSICCHVADGVHAIGITEYI